jgi:hypothetical protein
VEELERREVLSLNPTFAAGPFPVAPGTFTPPLTSRLPGQFGLPQTTLMPGFPDVRGTYTGTATSDFPGRTDQFTLQIEQQVTNGTFHGIVLPNRHQVGLKRIQQQIGPNFPWVVLTDGRVIPKRQAQQLSGNNFQGTFTIANLGMAFTMFGTFGKHGAFRAAAVDGQHVLVVQGIFVQNTDGTASLQLGYRLQMAPGQVDHGTAVLTGTPAAPPNVLTPLFG